MPALTVPAALALALSCNIPPSIVPIIVGIARHESGLDPQKINHNTNGTIDAGLAQVNSSNWGWLGIHSLTEALDPCTSLRGGVRVLLARYNGNPPDSGKVLYSAAVLAAIPKAAVAAPPNDEAPGLEDTPGQPETLEIKQ